MQRYSNVRGLLRPGLLIGASLNALVLATPSLAQPVGGPVPQDTINPDEPAPLPTVEDLRKVPPKAKQSDSDTIIVTGSRIRQPEFTSPDPVARIDPKTAKQEGKFETADMLQSSPIAAGSTQITSAISSNFVTNGGPGAQTIDLRGLGANRTLVLINGRRAGPAGTRGGVSSFDLNVLPQSIVDRVDILKTGASSIYGSDAVAGVVNLITKTDFNGLQIDGFANVPVRKGGEQFNVSMMWGKTFERGHVLLAVDYFHQNELARGDRKYLGCPEAYIFNKTGGGRADLVDPRTGSYHCEDLRWGHIWTYDLEYLYGYGPGNLYAANGKYAGPVALLQYQYPGETLGIPPIASPPNALTQFGSPPGWFPTGYDPASTAVQNAYHPFVNEQSLIPKTSRYTVYADGSYDITDSVQAYGEFLANRRKTYQNGWRQFWNFGGTSDFIGNFWAPDFTGFDYLSPTGITNHSDSSQKVDYWRSVGGLRGDLGGFMKGWSFDSYVQYSHNKGLYRTEQLLQDVYNTGYFQTSSCVGQVTPISHKQCIDLPWADPFFLRGEMTPQQVDFLFDWETGKTIYKQLSGEASITGNLFDLPAGPVGIALGIDARQDSINDKPGAITLAHNAWGAGFAGITMGKSITTEAFGEIQVPLLRDRPMVKDLSFSGAARLTNVKSTREPDGFSKNDKGNWTYKLGGNWAVNPWLRFRGTYGTSFRAPALFEQFQASETSSAFSSRIDPCVLYDINLAQGNISQRIRDNCAAAGIPPNYSGAGVSATIVSQGGIGSLVSETSVAKTASVILTPHFAFLPDTRMSLAVDYFDIEVKGEVSKLGARNILFGCYDSPSFPSDPLCSLFTRGLPASPYNINTITDRYINIARQRNQGLDFTGLIQHNLGHLGSLTFNANVTYQLKDTIALFANTEKSNNGDIGDPKFVGDFNLTWKSRSGLSLFWGTEVYGSASNNKKYIEANHSLCQSSVIYGDYCVHLTVPTTFYHNASVTKEFGKTLQLTLGMRNIFDTKPPRVSTVGGTGIPPLIGPVVGTSQYDFIGRRVFLNVTKKF